nr:hypothetical protein [Tanacetum cinerariifolium]
ELVGCWELMGKVVGVVWRWWSGLESRRKGVNVLAGNKERINSLPEYESFCFEIEPDQERLTSVVMNDISDDLSNDPLLEEVDLFLASDNSIPSGIGNIDDNLEGDIRFLEELLVDDSIPIPVNESSDFDNQDDPLFPRPPPKPPGAEFDFEPEIFLPYLIYPEVSLFVLSAGSEDIIFFTLASPFRAGGISLGWNFHML